MQDNVEAQCNLASLFQRGISTVLFNLLGLGVKLDEKKAYQIYSMAAANGSSLAMYNIGLCYHSGFGVPLNRGFGVAWFEKAAKLGNKRGQFTLGKCFYWVYQNQSNQRALESIATSKMPFSVL
jgi:TPR repeat protein